MSGSTTSAELRNFHSEAIAGIEGDFAARLDGRSTVSQRTALVDDIALRLWQRYVSPEIAGPSRFALVATGGYGRKVLCPYSDIDILFLHDGGLSESDLKERVRGFCQELWDLRFRLSPQTRSLAECNRFDDDNLEFTISLLDCRYLAGDREIVAKLRDSVVPRLVIREGPEIVRRLAELTQERHNKFGNTIFHLEPNIKDAPGGIRDYNVVHWLALISAIEKLRDGPNPDSLISSAVREQVEAALDYLLTIRCFLHFRHKRDDNTLRWEAQSEAAGLHLGSSDKTTLTTEDWMRVYFQQARTIQRLATRLLEELPASRSSLYREFQNWRSRLSNSNFSVVNGFILLQQPGGVKDSDLLLEMFAFMAEHGLKLGMATEQRIEQAFPTIAIQLPKTKDSWKYLRDILSAPHGADALRAMHHLRLLNVLLPELLPIDALVIRDYYHRFTVDEHSFMAIESLHRLREPHNEWEERYGTLLGEVEQPELLFFGLLLHDVGKGLPGTDHVKSSLATARVCLSRLALAPVDSELVCFLIESHLEMSAALRRDIFDHNTIRTFADKVGTTEKLKVLTLLTYADIRSVNPEALTPWKAENLWQLYIATSNELNRTVDQQRVHDPDNLIRALKLNAAKASKARRFLEGVPQRYLKTNSPEVILRHAEMADALDADSVQLDLKRGRHWFELTIVTKDRPALFSTIAGVLSAWGMNIVKANGMSNEAGVVVDTFYFTDRFRTLELNQSECDRFKKTMADVISGHIDLERLLQQRIRPDKFEAPKVRIDTKIDFDNASSSHCTLIQVIAQDRPGLLHRISSSLSHSKCNIEIALIDTEGQMLIDVFYVTSRGAKLSETKQEELHGKLLNALSAA